MTNPAASPTVAPTDSDQSLAEAPEAATLRGSLNGDAAPAARPVTRADDQTGSPSAAVPMAVDIGVGTSASPADPDDEQAPWEEWNGIFVGYAICQRETFESRSR